MTATPNRRPGTPTLDDQSDHIERALDALRREWKSGFNGRMVGMLALPSLRRLRDLVATQYAANELAEIERRLHAYHDLPIEARKTELVDIANRIKALAPDVRIGTAPAPEVGKLREALIQPKATAKTRPNPQQTTRAKPLKPDAPVTSLPRVGEAVAKKLANLKVATVWDLLNLSPRRHIDYTRTVKIGTILGFGRRDEVTIKGEILDVREIPGPGSARVTIRLADDTGWVRVTWFNSYLGKQFQPGMRIAISGLPDLNHGAPSFTNPEWERTGVPSLSTGRLTPVYPLTAGLAQKTMRHLSRAALDATARTMVDPLPAPLRAAYELEPLAAAFESLHYPATWGDLEASQRRLAFDNLLLLQLGLIQRKNRRTRVAGVDIRVDSALLAEFKAQLPFSLTGAQLRALDEILDDLDRGQPMARLLQGDVGSGKTAVAAAIAVFAAASGFQTAVMAPTEILAEQHFHNFRGLTRGLRRPPTVALLTGSTRAKERKELLSALESGEIDILVGTHALIQEHVRFANLGLTIIDEQHRFGVRQRAYLPTAQGGPQPHVLSMTATPIPRTLNMVLNGDMEVSIINELPPGRIPVDTRRYVGAERALAYQLVRQEVQHGHQVFVICPLVEESEASDMKAAVAEAERLKAEVFPEYEIATLHGRMKGREKDQIMTAFRDQVYDVLVSTSVIEVGIDVPNATVMLIEGADRFGLSQLHQFRGRVGRGGDRSYCLLLADETSPDGEARLDLMVETNDGFVLAEKDLELRGPGDFLGTRQSGLPEMSWIDGSFDLRLLDLARQAAMQLLDADPDLSRPEHAELRRRFEELWASAAVVETPLPS